MEGHVYYSPVIHHGANVSITDSRSYSSLNGIQGHTITTTEQLPLFFPITSPARLDPLQSMSLSVTIKYISTPKLYLQYLPYLLNAYKAFKSLWRIDCNLTVTSSESLPLYIRNVFLLIDHYFQSGSNHAAIVSSN